MRLNLTSLDLSLEIEPERINVLRFADALLFSRCAVSASCSFDDQCPERAVLLDGMRALKPQSSVYFVGDLLQASLADKRIALALLKKMAAELSSDSELMGAAELLDCELRELIEGRFLQLFGNYSFDSEWDMSKFLKYGNLCVDCSDSEFSLFQRALQLIDVAADLFPERVLCFVNLATYLDKAQYRSVAEAARAKKIAILSYERGFSSSFSDFENGLYIDEFYIGNR